MDRSTEKLLQSPTDSIQNIEGITTPPSVNYDTYPMNCDDILYSRDQIVPTFSLGSYRPEPLYAIHENYPTEGYSSLPLELPSTNDTFMLFEKLPQKRTVWEAEDAEEYITTLNEYNMSGGNTPSMITIAADIHYQPKRSRPSSLHSSNSQIIATGTPIESYPPIMTTSCYGELNNPFLVIKSDDEISLINKSTENLIDSINKRCSKREVNSLDNSIHNDGFNSMNSSFYEQKSIGSSIELDSGRKTSSVGGEMVDFQTSTSNTRRNSINSDERNFNINVIAENDLQAIKKLLENETGGVTCPCCLMPFDKGKKRKLIDTCGHEKCYTCVFTNEQCPLCNQQLNNTETRILNGSQQRITDYDTGIGSTSTIMSPIGSPYGQIRSHVKTNGHFTSYMQARQETGSPDLHQYNQHNTMRPPSIPQPRGFSDITSVTACATPPQNRRRFFNSKIRSPFNYRRSATTNLDHSINSTLSGVGGTGTSTSSKVVNYDTTVKRRIRDQHQKMRQETQKQNRFSLGETSAYAGHLGSIVFGKIKSLWSAHSTTFNSGLNQLIDGISGSGENNASTTSGRNDEGGNVKPIPLQSSMNKSKNSQDELQLRLGFFLENNNSRHKNNRENINRHHAIHQQSFSSLVSTNTSPVSTLTGSSEADIRPPYTTRGCDSVSSLMSVSISGHSNDDGSTSPMSRRHSVTATVHPNIEEQFKNRKTAIRRSARVGQIKGTVDPKIRFAQYRPPQLTLKPLFFEVPQQESDPLFIGRHWLLRELSNGLSTTESPGILLHGYSGTGKTALLLQLVEYSCFGRRKEIPSLDTDGIYCQINVVHDRIRSLASHVVAYHFSQADNNLNCLVPDFIHSLAAQLCQAPQLTAYRDYLMGEPHLQHILSVKECIADPYRAMRTGILEPLTNLRRVGKISGKNCIILIDGLCEAEYHRPDHGDTIGMFLAKISDHFPAWLKVIATIQTGLLEFVKGLPYTKMSLDNWTTNESLQKDMLDYITFRINHSSAIQNNISGGGISSGMAGGGGILSSSRCDPGGSSKFTQHLLNLTRGSFLFAKLILDLIERGNLVIKSSSYKVLPISLAQIFQLNFNLRFPTNTAFEKASSILCVCLAALAPLTLTEIYYSVNALRTTDDQIEWDEFISNFKQLSGFLIKRIDNTFMFFHPSFREWLIKRDDGESTKFLCDPRIGHSAIAFRLSRMQTPLNADQTLELGHHILKAHLYRNSVQNLTSRDLHSFWIANVTDDISTALCTLRNVYSPNVKVSRLLLLSGASPNYITEFLGSAPILCIAANEGIVPMVSLLLEFGADVERSNSQGCTPLILASSKGHCDVVRQLVAAGSSLGHVDTSHRCALVHAARSGRLSVVKYLIACDWLSRPEYCDIGISEATQQALIAAAAQGCLPIVEELIELVDVEIDKIDSLTGETALTTAASNGCVETVTLLLARGASVDIKNRKEMSPLLLAVKEGHWAVAERLLQNEANIEQDDTTGKTALMVAAEEGHVGIIELLLNRGASLTKVDREGLTALSWACLRGRLQAAKCLLERNADKHHADNTGRTPLDLAAYQGSAALVQMLIEMGGKIEHVDVNGMRPLDRAIACRNVQVVQVFLKRGAKLGPATWAMASGKPEILLLLLNKLLEDGNILYRKGRIQEAAHRYQYALKKIPINDNSVTSSTHTQTFVQLKFNFLLNYSRCRRKMNEISEAIDLATQAIELKPENYDGYFARSKAFFECKNWKESLKDVQMAIDRSSSTQTSQDIKNVLIRLKTDISSKYNTTEIDCVLNSSVLYNAETNNSVTDL